MNLVRGDDGAVVYALVCLKTGAVLQATDRAGPSAALDDLAAAAPELLREVPDELGALFARLGSARREPGFREIAFVSSGRAHVLRRLPRAPDMALLAMSADGSRLGLLIAEVHARVARMESES